MYSIQDGSATIVKGLYLSGKTSLIMPKRDLTEAAASSRENDLDEVETEDQDRKRGKTTNGSLDNEEEEDIEVEEIDGEDEDDFSGPTQNFVAWLEEDSTALSVGELHFSNVEHTGSPDAPNTYCVVYEMKLQPPNDDEEEDEETPLVFSFRDGFPFRVLPALACVGIPLEPVFPVPAEAAAKTEDDSEEELICSEYSLQADIHQSLLEDLLGSISEKTYTKVSPQWKLPKQISNSQTIDGLNAWWKAGEAKAGWDLSKIPKEDYTTSSMVEGSANNKNILLDLYKDLCAFSPLTSEDDRDAIEERFEWRTCLCTYFAWAVPNDHAIKVLQNLGQPILEIGAGTGYWAWLLSQAGVDIVAYDAEDSHDGHKHRFRHSLVRDGGVEQASSKEHSGRALMLCWPDIVGDSALDDADRGTFGFDTLKTFEGDTVVYVGELGPGVVKAAKGWGDPFPPGGSSASAAFQKELLAKFEMTQRVELPNWPPYNSHLTVWKRR